MGRQKERDIASRISDGSYRRGKHGALDIKAPEGAARPTSFDAPSGFPELLAPFYKMILRELLEEDSITTSDLPLLEAAVRQYGTAKSLQERLDRLAEDPKSSAAEIARIQAAASSAQSAANRIFAKFGVASPFDRAKVRAATPKNPDPNRPKSALDYLKRPGYSGGGISTKSTRKPKA